MTTTKSRPHYDKGVVKDAARGQWAAFLSSKFGLDASILDGQHHPCPNCGGKDRFRTFRDFPETGGVFCNQCHSDNNSDGIATVQWLMGCDFTAAVALIAEHFGVKGTNKSNHGEKRQNNHSKQSKETSAHRDAEPAGKKAIDEAILNHRRKILGEWAKGTADTGRIRQYLDFRGISIPVPSTLRIIGSLDYWIEGPLSLGSWPVMLAKIQRANGAIVGLHRTFLAIDEHGKATIPGGRSPKKVTLSPTVGQNKIPQWINGAAIQLYPADNTVAVTEGIETALAVHEATNIPVWSATSANGIKTIDIPPTIINVEIWADTGSDGEEAAYDAAVRLSNEGHHVSVFIPPVGYSDWLDALVGNRGEE